MPAKEEQINLRLPRELNVWVERQAGGSRMKAAYIRALLERERARTEEEELRAMFDQAWDSLSPEERASETGEREQWLRAHTGSEG